MFEWSRPYPVWVYWLLAIGLVTLVLIARRLAISERLRRAWLFLPRLAVFALLLVVLLNPVRRDEIQLPSEPASVFYLVDCSRSMALDIPIARLDQAKQLIQQSEQSLAEHGRPDIQLYGFGEQLRLAADLAQLNATDDASDLAGALRNLPNRFGSDMPRGVVIFSDGTVGDAFDSHELANIYRKLKVPLHTVSLGNRGIRGDLAVQELVLPPRVDRGSQVPVRAVIRSRGFEDERILLTVHAANRPELALATLPLTLNGSEQPVELVVEANQDLGELVLALPRMADEAIDTNNEVPFRLNTKSRKIKVLYMEGTASDEYHWVHEALTEDKDIECTSMYADHQYVERPRLMRANDPYKGFPATREELLEYDCIICSDISRGAFTQEQLDWTVELVAERGGGFAMVGGITSFGAGNWDQTVWDKLIPVDMAGGRVGQGYVYYQFNIQVPPDSITHPIWRIVNDPEENQRIIAAMPLFLGTNYMQRLKPAATALAYSATPIPNAGIMPIMACETYGKGRTFALAPDTTADWGRLFESQWGEGDNRYFRKFWRNVVRWLTENSMGENRRLQVETDRIIYRPDQPILITATAYDESMQQTSDYQLTARLFVGAGPRRTALGAPLGLLPSTSELAYQGRLAIGSLPAKALQTKDMAGLVPGELEVVARHQGKVVTQTTLKVQVLNDSVELANPLPVPGNLAALSEKTGGKRIEQSSQLAELLMDLPAKKGDVLVSKQPMWDQGFVWLAIIGFLSVEWTLRRWAGFA